jgi:hypothetical protein
MVVFLSKGREVLHNILLQCDLVLKSFLLFILPLSNLQQWHNFDHCVRYLVCIRVSLDYHSVPFDHLWICCTTQTLPFGLKHSGLKQSQTCNVSCSLTRSFCLQKFWPLLVFQTWNNFQSCRPLCLLVKFRHGAGDWYEQTPTKFSLTT